jgi:large subunit ribosomal protein L9
MEIILIQDVERLGSKDDIVNVKDGFARNFLIPQKKAVAATSSAKKVLAENIKQRAHKETRLREEAQAIAEKLANKKVKIGAKVSSAGKIFGSVNTIQVAEAINKKGFEIERKQITCPKTASKKLAPTQPKLNSLKMLLLNWNLK